MARREEVFQSKVFQKLYPAPPELEKEPSRPSVVDALSRKTHVQRKASQRDASNGDAGRKTSAANPGKRMYTVLPPPADHKTDSEKSATLHQLESINSADDPAEGSVLHDSDGEPDQDEAEEEPQRRRRRRKRKVALRQDSGKDGAAGVSESGPVQSRAAGDEGRENLSRNKKRKLKKKRHKEKLLATGLMPRAAALEFTYRKDDEEEEEEEEEEDNETRAAEVSHFLRTTMELYMSDPSLRSDQRPLLGGTVNNLLSRVADGCRPPCALQQLYALKALVQRRQPDALEKALVELPGTSPLSSEETGAVVSLFRYWITHILPMQGDETASSDARRGTHADRSGDVFQSAETDSGLHPAAADAGLPPRVRDPPS